MTHKVPMKCWAVWLDEDHIHTDYQGRLAVFDMEAKAKAWIRNEGGPFVGRLTIRPHRMTRSQIVKRV